MRSRLKPTVFIIPPGSFGSRMVLLLQIALLPGTSEEVTECPNSHDPIFIEVTI